MNRKFLAAALLFLLFPYIAYSVKTFIIEETEEISLQPTTSDPDSDQVSTIYENPLNKDGEWQTDYGDVGEYKTKVTITDGTSKVSEDILIVVKRKEAEPFIESSIPIQESLQANEGETINFRVLASDLNKDKLQYEWNIDGKLLGQEQEFHYLTKYTDSGTHRIKVTVSDGKFRKSKEWSVDVLNVDVQKILDDIQDIELSENELARLVLPDFEKYGLTYTISDPIGNDNEWQTGYNDAGNHEVKVYAEGKGFSGQKKVNIKINNVDRLPAFEQIKSAVVNEGDEVRIMLNAADPDNDELIISAEDLPEGAKLEKNIFTWKPGFDVVSKEGVINKLTDQFRDLSKTFYVKFTATAGGKKIVQNAIITVKNANRAPTIEMAEELKVNEGDLIKLDVKAYDLDGDKVKLSYSGYLSSATYQADYDDAGVYYVTVAASDGALETAKKIKIEILESNRAPTLEKIPDIVAKEGDEIAITLNGKDADNDKLAYSLENPPKNSHIKDNIFYWKPGLEVASKGQSVKTNLVFKVSDGRSEAKSIAKADIIDRNRKPIIKEATKGFVTNVNKPVMMQVEAYDEDGDSLTYTWEFSMLEKYKATSKHQRVFTTPGLKTIKVVVSDGVDAAEQIISVNVV